MAWCYSCLFGEVAENAKKCPHCGADIPYIPPEKQAGATQTQIPLPVGTILQGKYLVGRFLGIGGNGITYVVRDMSLGLRLAVKEFFPNQNFQRDASLNVNCTNEGSLIVRTARQRFRQESLCMGEISKRRIPNTVQVYNTFHENNTDYIVMEYIEGTSLQAKMKQNPNHRIPYAEAVEIAIVVLETLSYLHEANILHRDISTDNIMCLPKPGEYALIDYGNSTWISDQSVRAQHKAAYTPPEQYNNGIQGPYTDVFSVAATIFRAVAGKPPRRETEHGQTLPPLSSVVPDANIPPWLDDLLIYASQSDPAKRLQTAAEFRKELLRHYSSERPAKKHLLPLAIVGATVLLFGGGILRFLGSGNVTSQPTQMTATLTATPTQGEETNLLPGTSSPAYIDVPVETTFFTLTSPTHAVPTAMMTATSTLSSTTTPTPTPTLTPSPTPYVIQYQNISIDPSFISLINSYGYLQTAETYLVTGVATPQQHIVLSINDAACSWAVVNDDGTFSMSFDSWNFNNLALNSLSISYEDNSVSSSTDAYLSFVYKADVKEVSLSHDPAEGQETIRGQCESGATVVLSIDDQPPLTSTCDHEGFFAFEGLVLLENQRLVIVSEDLAGNSSQKEYIVQSPVKVYANLTLDNNTFAGINAQGYLKAAETHFFSGTASPNERLLLRIDNKIVAQDFYSDEMGHFTVSVADEHIPTDATVTVTLDYADIDQIEQEVHAVSLAFLYKRDIADVQLSNFPQEGEGIIAGITESDATVVFTAPGAEPLQVLSDGNGYFEFSNVAVLEGETVTISVTDAADNTVSRQYSVEAAKIIYTPIQLSLHGLNANNYASAGKNLRLIGKATPEATVHIILGDGSAFDVTSDAQGEFGFDIQSANMLAGVVNEVVVQYTSPDAAEYGDTSASASFQYRTPINELSITSIVRDGVQTLAGKTEPSVSVRLQIDGEQIQTTYSDEDGVFEFKDIQLEANSIVSLTVTDEGSNKHTIQQTVQSRILVTLNQDIPLINGVISNHPVTGMTSFDVFASSQNGRTVLILIDGEEITRVDKFTGREGESCKWNQSIDVRDLKHGSSHSFAIRYEDCDENEIEIDFRIDSQCQDIVLNETLDGKSTSLRGTAEAGATVTMKCGDTIYTTVADRDQGFFFRFEPLPEDEEVTFVAEDNYGNRSKKVTCTVSPFRRDQLMVTTAKQSIVGKYTPFTATGTGTAGEKIQIKLIKNENLIAYATTIVKQNGTWSQAFDLPLSSGDYDIVASYEDTRFSYGTTRVPYITVDAECEPITGLMPASLDTDSTIISGVTEKGAKVQLWINGREKQRVEAGSDGSFAFDLSDLKTNDKLHITATDSYNNTSETTGMIVNAAPVKFAGKIDRPAKNTTLSARDDGLQFSYSAQMIGSADTVARLAVFDSKGQHIADLPSKSLDQEDILDYAKEYSDTSSEQGWEFRGRYTISNPDDQVYYLRLIAERKGAETVLQEITMRAENAANETSGEATFDFLSDNLDYAVGIDRSTMTSIQPLNNVVFTGWFYAPQNSTITYSFIIDGVEYSTGNALNALGGQPRYNTLPRTVLPNSGISMMMTVYDNIDTGRAGKTISLNLSKLEEGKHTFVIKQTITLSTTSVMLTRSTPEFTIELRNQATPVNVNSITSGWR